MSYVQETLAPGETVRATARLHWLIWLRAWTVLILLGVFVVGVLYFLAEWMRIANTEIALTNRRLILKRGILTRRTNELELLSVESVSLEQDVWGRLFGFGRLTVQGTGDDAWVSPLISAPVGFRRAIEAALSDGAAAKTTPRDAALAS